MLSNMRKFKLKSWVIVGVVIITLAAGIGCWLVASRPKLIKGYMMINDHILYVDEVEIITSEDERRIKELGLDQDADMPEGYYIYNADTEYREYELTDKTTYTFVDVNLLYIAEEDGDRVYTTTKVDEFLHYLDMTYADFPRAQRVPFFIEVKDGKVISITEKFEYTI